MGEQDIEKVIGEIVGPDNQNTEETASIVEGTVECEDLQSTNDGKKYKSLRLKTNEFIFDATSLILPFIAEYRGDTVLQVEVSQKRQNKDSTIRVRSSVLGVPTLYDKSVLMALQKLFVMQKRSVSGNVLFNIQEAPKSERTMKPVTFREIYRAMGYTKNPTSNQLLKISESIERLSETTYVIEDDMIYNHVKGKYVVDENTKASMHLIDYKKVTYSEEEKEARQKHASRFSDNKEAKDKYRETKKKIIDGKVQIILSEVVYESLSCDQLVYYNDPLVLGIKNSLAKHIFILAKKWAGKNKEVTIGFKTILMYIPMKEGVNLSNQKSSIKNALKYLHDNNLCTITYLANDNIHFNFKAKAALPKKEKDSDYLHDRFNNIIELKQGFVELGFEEDYVFTLDLADLKYYAALLRYITLGVKYGRIAKPKEYMVSMIENRTDVDKKYYTN